MCTSGDDEIQRLQRKLKEADDALQKAGQYGLQLLDGQLDLQNKLEEQRIEMTNAVEVLEQEKYSLQREVVLKSRVLDSLRSDYDSIKSQRRLQWEQHESLLERNHAMELNECKNKMERMRSELDEVQLSEKQLRHKLELQTETLSIKMEELRSFTGQTHETLSTEMMELQVERMELEAAKATLELALQEAQYKEQQLELTNTNLQRQLERISEEKEECEREAVSCFNTLEKAREANQDLQIQLDQLLQQAQDPNSKGNSLFGELEDKRAEMERQLISMKVQHQSLLKQHAFSKQQLHRMKVQIATLMQLQGSRADPAQLERLQSMLSEKNSEIQALMIKLRRLEKVEMTLKAQPSSAPVETDSGDGTYYTDLLKMQLSNSAKDAERLGDELSMQRMKSLSESQRALELERKLFSAERAHKQSQSDNIKLQVKVEELRLKYEPNEVNKKHIQKRKREKLPVDIPNNIPEVKKEEPMVLELPKHMKEEMEAEAHPSTEERLIVTPLQPPNNPKPNSALTRDSKCVHICEEPPTTIPNPPRSPSADCKTMTEELEMEKEGEENRRDEKKKLKSQEVIHVTSQKTLENQCAQQ
ncbi:protein Spindly [Salvelinus fontinalis]|uniref:protein Spindly n=1 Tax=Salvelinus fontinalis TaxID=8038 RepID=UPI00248693DF|nr:protein Spindly [Salvelinus fontinalis]XP_055782509.1 protein Spindly [Salvelinus fontinalis]